MDQVTREVQTKLLKIAGLIGLLLRAPIRARRKGRTEQAIIRRYLAVLKEHAFSPPEEAPDPVPSNA